MDQDWRRTPRRCCADEMLCRDVQISRNSKYAVLVDFEQTLSFKFSLTKSESEIVAPILATYFLSLK